MLSFWKLFLNCFYCRHESRFSICRYRMWIWVELWHTSTLERLAEQKEDIVYLGWILQEFRKTRHALIYYFLDLMMDQKAWGGRVADVDTLYIEHLSAFDLDLRPCLHAFWMSVMLITAGGRSRPNTRAFAVAFYRQVQESILIVRFTFRSCQKSTTLNRRHGSSLELFWRKPRARIYLLVFLVLEDVRRCGEEEDCFKLKFMCWASGLGGAYVSACGFFVYFENSWVSRNAKLNSLWLRRDLQSWEEESWVLIFKSESSTTV